MSECAFTAIITPQSTNFIGVIVSMEDVTIVFLNTKDNCLLNSYYINHFTKNRLHKIIMK